MTCNWRIKIPIFLLFYKKSGNLHLLNMHKWRANIMFYFNRLGWWNLVWNWPRKPRGGCSSRSEGTCESMAGTCISWRSRETWCTCGWKDIATIAPGDVLVSEYPWQGKYLAPLSVTIDGNPIPNFSNVLWIPGQEINIGIDNLEIGAHNCLINISDGINSNVLRQISITVIQPNNDNNLFWIVILVGIVLGVVSLVYIYSIKLKKRIPEENSGNNNLQPDIIWVLSSLHCNC